MLSLLWTALLYPTDHFPLYCCACVTSMPPLLPGVRFEGMRWLAIQYEVSAEEHIGSKQDSLWEEVFYGLCGNIEVVITTMLPQCWRETQGQQKLTGVITRNSWLTLVCGSQRGSWKWHKVGHHTSWTPLESSVIKEFSSTLMNYVIWENMLSSKGIYSLLRDTEYLLKLRYNSKTVMGNEITPVKYQ